MGEKLLRIGISGGTFDPVHMGHLVIAEEVRQVMSLDKVLFIPSGNPPHKNALQVTRAEHRFEMVRRAIATNPFFEASGIEIDRPGNTYTIDTLKQLRGIYGDMVRLFFITGADVVTELTTWKNFENVFKLCEFIAVMRPGYRSLDFDNHIRQLSAMYGAVIHAIAAPLIGISSTEVRRRVLEGRSVKYLVPDGVEEYIYGHGLYRE